MERWIVGLAIMLAAGCSSAVCERHEALGWIPPYSVIEEPSESSDGSVLMAVCGSAWEVTCSRESAELSPAPFWTTGSAPTCEPPGDSVRAAECPEGQALSWVEVPCDSTPVRGPDA